MSLKPRHDGAPARFANDAERGVGGWHDPDDNESWDGEDRHYIPGPKGPEAVIDDDYEHKHQLPSDESDEDNWIYCWNCDSPVRSHWETCPALGCGVGLKYSNLKNRKADAKSSQKFREAPIDMKDEPTSDPLKHNIPLNNYKKPVESFDQGLLQRGRSQSPQNETVNVYSVKIPVDLASGETFEAEIPGQGLVQVTVPVDSVAGETIEIEVPCVDGTQDQRNHDPTVEDTERESPNRGGGTVSFREDDGIGSPEEVEALLRPNKSRPSRTQGSLRKPVTNPPDDSRKVDEIKAKFRQGSISDFPPPEPSPSHRDAGLSSPLKVRAGAESLGATKAPDWTRHLKDKRSEGQEEQWRVHLNDDVKNFQEQIHSKQRGFVVCKNTVSTSKYTFYNFVFLNLGQQFSRLANVYFLIIAVLQLFTKLSPTGRFSTAAPLSLVVAANMVREIWEDSKRHKDDRDVNHRIVEVVKEGKITEEYWKDLCVGDIVWIKKGQEVPADLIQLSSSDDKGVSYIDTCNLDGETNLKIKSSLSVTNFANSHSKVSSLSGSLDYEFPNKRLYTFVGTATIDGSPIPVDNDCIILRGSVLCNTKFMYGLVVYAGKQTKILMNSKSAVIKRSNLERMANQILAFVLLFEMIMCTLGAVGNLIWARGNSGAWYMPFVKSISGFDVFFAWITYFILLNNYVPISLYVSMELAKLGQKILMDHDAEMYHAQTDTPCLARTSTLNEELGQIQYIFSDKTGTLTRNEMEFRKCWVAGTSYGFGTTEIGRAAIARGLASTEVETEETKTAQRDADPQRAQFFYDPKIGFDDVRIRHRIETRHRDYHSLHEFFRVLSVAHTVVPEGDPGKMTPDKVKYQAESPDEGALVHAARVLGFCFLGKTATTHTVNIFGEMETYEMLHINKFTSSRKRMSAVVRTPDGDVELYIKGADNVMFERIRANENIGEVEEIVKSYGREGLRTLIIAKRKISEEEYERWKIQFQAASTALTGREELLAQAAEDIEYDLEVLGATAIEDKLQIGVPDAIATLALARIRIWVLTGDKQETAENIGFACNLLKDDMERVYLISDSAQELLALIQEATLSRFQFFEKEDPSEELALIVDGKALLCIMSAVENPNATPQEIELMTKFLSFAKMCKAVIACRVSPDQKRQIVAMVKLNTKPIPMTLAIGDGANDVPMILEASVGVGISGNEGMQAVRSSDYAIAQFAYLKRLLLVHGRSNYKRVSTVVMYSLYKNCFLVSSLFIYGMFTGWTGTALYDSLMLAGFNVGWAFAGIIVFGTIENDVSPAAALAYPQLYGTGVRKADFNVKVLIKWEFGAIYHTILCFLVPAYCFLGKIVRASADDDGLVTFGMCHMQALVIAVNLKLMLITSNLTYISVVAYLGSILLYMIGGLTHSLWPLSSLFASESYVFYNIMPFLYASPSNWLVQVLTVACVLIPEVIMSYIKRNFFPDPCDVVRELDLGYGEGLMAHATAPKSEIESDEKNQKN